MHPGEKISNFGKKLSLQSEFDASPLTMMAWCLPYTANLCKKSWQQKQTF